MDATPDLLAELPSSTPEPIARALRGAIDAWSATLGSRLVSLVLFGSVARGEATASADIDLCAVVKEVPRSLRDRRNVLLAEWDRVRREQRLGPVEWNLVVKTPDEARHHSPLYLDMVEDGILLIDHEGFFAAVLDEMRARMRALGSRRVFLSDGSWYWDLKPDFRFGEIVEL